MATLADELLNDFEDSDSEQGDDTNDYQNIDESHAQNGDPNNRSNSLPGMELDEDEESMGDAEEEVEARQAKGDIPEDEDDTKAKVERMKLGGVSDVRNVAGLMKTLQPVLEVSIPPPCRDLVIYQKGKAVLTPPVVSRKSHIIRAYLKKRERLASALSRMIRNTSYSHSQTHWRRRLTARLFWYTSSSEITTRQDFPNSKSWSRILWTMPRLSLSSGMDLSTTLISYLLLLRTLWEPLYDRYLTDPR